MNKPRSNQLWSLAAWIFVLFLQAVSQGAMASEKTTALELAEQKAFQQAVNAVAGAVVQLRYVGNESPAPVTGVVVAPKGWIVTSLEGLEDQPTAILVTFADGKQCPAKLVARDFHRHLALLQAENKNGDEALPLVELQAAKVVQPGQWAIAIGRTHRTDKVSLTVGVVSASSRFGGRAVQTDAAVSPSNYGGPLVNLSGEVIGILVPLAPQGQQGTDWYDSGIGFVVPFDQILDRLERMQAGHDIKPGQLGLTLAPGDRLRKAPVVEAILPLGPTQRNGVLKGDRIIAFNGQAVSTSAELARIVSGHDAGEKVRLRLRNNGEEREVNLVLAPPLPVP